MAESGKHTSRSRWLYIGSLIILIIVVVTFVGAPLITSTAGSARPVFGSYAGEEIEYSPGNFFARQYETIAQSLRESGNDANLELQLRIAWREAFNRAVLHTALMQEADDGGMNASAEAVDELIASDPRFQVNGRFDADRYRGISNQERFALREFYRQNAVFDQMLTDVLTGSQSSAAERAFVAGMSGPERSFDVVRFPFSEFPDEEVSQFAGENPDLFTSLELAVVTLANEDEAQQIRSQALEPGNPIGDLARTYSRDAYADQDGQIGTIYGYELQQELVNPEDLEAILALEPGELTEALETTAGWAFYELLETPEAFDPQGSGAIDTVRAYMQNFEQGRIQDFVRAAAQDFAETARTEGLATAASAAERDVLSTPFFPINYGNLQLFGQVQSTQIPELSNAAFREDFFRAAFSLQGDEVSEPLALQQSVVVMRLREEQPVSDSDVSFITDFYDSLLRQFHSDSVRDAFIDEERLDDNFNQAFARFVLGTN